MIVSPKNLKLNKILRDRTLNFDTNKKTYGNLVLIPTNDRDEFYKTVSSSITRPQQMMAVFSPRIVRPLGRAPIRYNAGELYSTIKANTNGRIIYCKITPTLYNGRNLTYDITNEIIETEKLILKIKSGKIAIDYLRKFLREDIKKKIEEIGYEKNYVIFPMTKYIEKLRSKIISSASMETTPYVLFLKDLRSGELGDSYKNVNRVIFYNPNANAMVVIDPNSETLQEDFQEIFLKLNRLNNFNNSATGETLSDDVETADLEMEPEDYAESVKEEIKNVVFKKVAKDIKANNLTDFEDATKEEREIMLAIDKKIDNYLEKPENIQKPFKDLVDEVEKDNSVKSKAIKYVETKRIAVNKAINMSKNLTKEVEEIDKVSDISTGKEAFEPDKFNTKVKLDPRVQESTLLAMDREYNTKVMRNDLNEAISSFSNASYLPAAVTSIRYEDTSDDLNEKETVHVQYKTDDNQSLSFQLDIPKIVDGHCIYVNGNKYIIAKQLLRLPIVKTKADRVEITTSYQKMTIERSGSKISRKNAYLLKTIKEYNNPKVEILFGDNSLINSKYDSDFEFEELSSSISMIKTDSITLNLNRDIMDEYVSAIGFPEDFITSEITPIGYDGEDKIFYINDGIVYSGQVNDGEVEIKKIEDSLYDFIIKDVLKTKDTSQSIGKAFIYSTVKFLTVKFPVFVIVGLMNGMTNILDRHNVKYKIFDKKANMGPAWVEVPFKNKYLYYEDKLENTMLLNILYAMSTEDYDIEDFDTDGPFMDYLVDRMGQPMYVKQTLMINLDKMIDPITYSILVDMKLPTNIHDLLLIANNMLTNNKYQPLNDLTNYRIRGNEVIAAALYEILSTNYKDFQRYKMNGNAKNLVVKRNELISKLIVQSNINVASDLNPILELENTYQCSAKGLKGVNLSRAYTLEMRAYDNSMVGYLSGNATSYSGSVGINRGLSFNPRINSVRGYITKQYDDKSISAANMLSVTEMLSPFTAAQADAPRGAMNVAQSKHIVPTKVMSKQLFGSGVNKEIPYMLSDTFCFKAKKDGTLEEIDNENKLAILKYVDGTSDAIDLNETMVRNSNSGFFVKQTFLLAYEQGEKFNKGDVIAYNPSFFKGKGNDMDYCSGSLAKVAVACGDFAFEDATIVSEKLSEKCATHVTMCKSVALNPNTIIHSIADVGSEVEPGEVLMEFTSAEDDISAEILQGLYDQLGKEDYEELIHETISSKYHGILEDVKIYYNVPFETLNPSLQTLINNYKKYSEKRKQKLISKGVTSGSVKIPPIVQQQTKKINGTEFEGVLIEFYIGHEETMNVGDKMTFQTALKGVISKVLTESESPVSEYRSDEIIEAIETPTGIISRMCIDFYSILWVNKVLVEVGKQIKEIWES